MLNLEITSHSLIWMASRHLLTTWAIFDRLLLCGKYTMKPSRPDHLLMVVTKLAVVQIESRIVIGLPESASSPWAKVAILDSSIGIPFPCASSEGSNRFGLALAGYRGMSPNYSRIKGSISLTVTYPPSIRCCYLEPVGGGLSHHQGSGLSEVGHQRSWSEGLSWWCWNGRDVPDGDDVVAVLLL